MCHKNLFCLKYIFLALFCEIKSRQEDFMRAFNSGDAQGAALVPFFYSLKNIIYKK